MEKDFALIINETYPEAKFNLLTPMKTVTEISEIHKPVMNVVRISTNVNDKEIYEQDKSEHLFALTKKGLEKLMRAAGIKIVESKPIVPSTCRKCAEMNRAIGTPVNCYKCGNKDVAHEVTISVPQLTGENISITKSKEICVDVVTKGMKPRQTEEFMKFRCEMCETKAMNRALRSALHIKGAYSLAELQKPFVVAYLVPNLDNEDVKRAAIEQMFTASDKLFAGNALAPAPAENDPAELPPPRGDQQPALTGEAEFDCPPFGEAPPVENYPEPPYEEYDPAPPPAQNTYSQPRRVCRNCNAGISDKVYDFSVKRYGIPLCMDCQKRQGGRG